MAKLLVSVRNKQEARDAIAGGADLIDIKEPAYGSLGRANSAIIAEVAAEVGSNRPVSAAMGELASASPIHLPTNLRFAKWGLSGYGTRSDWSSQLAEQAAAVRSFSSQCEPVGVAYADYLRADAPLPVQVCSGAASIGCTVLLIDTFVKDGSHLLNWISPDELLNLRSLCRSNNMQLALAGGISLEMLPGLIDLGPDWIAIRGAACHEGRTGSICPEKVRKIAEQIYGTASIETRREDLPQPGPFAAQPCAKAL